jgi:bacterioferritin (cytochrome b1)
MSDEEMDVPEVCARLAKAVALQVASLGSLTLLGGTVTGLASAGLKSRLRDYAVDEVEDTVLLVEKLIALGGKPATYDAPPPPGTDLVPAVKEFLDREEELLAALHAVIEPSGQEPRSEALEHRIEHVIMRKQEQVDFLRLALREPGD